MTEASAEKITLRQATQLAGMAREAGLPTPEILGRLCIARLEDIPASEFEMAKARIGAMIEEMGDDEAPELGGGQGKML